MKKVIEIIKKYNDNIYVRIYENYMKFTLFIIKFSNFIEYADFKDHR